MSATDKVSVTIGRAELVKAKRLADHLGLSLSGFITDALRARIEEQSRREAALEVLAAFAPEERASPEEARALLEGWEGAERSAVSRKPKRKAPGKQRRTAR